MIHPQSLEQAAEEYAIDGKDLSTLSEKETYGRISARSGFLAGAKWMRESEGVQALVEALEYIRDHSCGYCEECVSCGSQHKPEAIEALKKWKDGE